MYNHNAYTKDRVKAFDINYELLAPLLCWIWVTKMI